MSNPPGGPSDGTMTKGAVIARRYVLDRMIGAGGFSQVWLAEDPDLKRAVALKFLKQELMSDETALADLKTEVLLTQTLRHHHIVQIYDFVRDDRIVGYSMEYVKGKTLFKLASEREHRCFEPADIEGWLVALCRALHYAHTPRGGRRAVVHRDLKPGNLMVDENDELRVLDFGISRTITETRFRTTQPADADAIVVGTVPYMSPEQLRGRPASPSDDIYALGATVFELLTSRPPFHTGAIHLQVLNEPVPTMTERRVEFAIPGPPIPPQWEEVIGACLAKEAKDRPRTVRDVYERLGLEAASQLRPSAKRKAEPAPAPAPTMKTKMAGQAPAPAKRPPGTERRDSGPQTDTGPVTPWWKRNAIRVSAAAVAVAVVSVLLVGIDRIAESIGIGSRRDDGTSTEMVPPPDPDASLREDVRSAMQKGAFDRAAPMVDRLLAKIPGDPEAASWKRQIDAAKLAQEAARLKSETRGAIAREDTLAAWQALEKLKTLAPGDDDLPDLERDLGTLAGTLRERARQAESKTVRRDGVEPPAPSGPTDAERRAEQERQLDAKARSLKTRIGEALNDGAVDAATPLVAELRGIRPQSPELPDMEKRLAELQRIRDLRSSITRAVGNTQWTVAKAAVDELLQLVPADLEAGRWQVEISEQISRGEIRDLLKAYEDAWESRDADAYRGLWPTMPKDTYRQLSASFADLKAIALDLSGISITLKDDSATVTMDERRSFTPRTGDAPKPVTSPVALELRKNAAGRWEITQRSAR